MIQKPLLLIIEDDTLLASTMRDKFVSVGFKVVIAGDGDIALTKLRALIPQIVLLDLLLPKKNGFDILSQMKQNPLWKQIPVVIASNLNGESDIDRGYALGAGDYIVKSNLSLNDLVQKVVFLLNMSSHGKKFLNSIGQSKFTPKSL
ncbi:MAG: response regulator [Microgenomates group bacterium]